MPKAIELDERQVIDLYARYDNCRQVADILGVSNGKVWKVLKKNNVPRTGNRTKERRHHLAKCAHRDNCYALFRMLYDVLGGDAQSIASTLGANAATVWAACCKSRGIHGRACKADFPISQIEREYLSGATTYELAERYGVRHETISRWMRQLGHHRGKFAKRKKPMKCLCCGSVFISDAHNAKYCSQRCRYKDNRRASDYRSRCERFGVEYDESITLDAVFNREHGVCYICGSRCDYHDVSASGGVGYTYPTIDHVIPLCKGGGHTRDNVKLACWLCNSIKRENELTDDLRESIIERKTAACC